MRLRRLLRLLLLSQRLLQPRALAGVMLPVQQLLLINELGALSVDLLLPEVLVLQQLQHVQAVGVPAGGAKDTVRNLQAKGPADCPVFRVEKEKNGALLQELGVLWLLPVQQVLQVVDEGSLLQEAPLSQNCRQTGQRLSLRRR